MKKVTWPFWIHRSWGWCGEAVVLNFCHCIVIHWGSLVKIHHRSDITVMLNIHRQTPLLWHFHFCVSKYMQRENDGCQSLKSVPHWILPVSLCNKNIWEIPWCKWSRCKNLSWHYDNTRVYWSERREGLFPEPSRYNRGFMASRVILTGQHKWHGPQRNTPTKKF